MLQKIPFVAISVLLVAQMSLPVFANNLTATVVSVGDGDTIRVRIGNKTVTVPLKHLSMAKSDVPLTREGLIKEVCR
ncbi:hypothetical protein [Nostoc sp. GT001]|uniref:hypothetical protein n=1 Tax=Nostoc sp. GT001 TaxID=3056647 RepID=UPI0025AB54EC|nr:hypothetical protein [Nostoc sp. GT001]MDM9580169.1 hypothetical protein [Nostoc sp. GT001]